MEMVRLERGPLILGFGVVVELGIGLPFQKRRPVSRPRKKHRIQIETTVAVSWTPFRQKIKNRI